MRPQQEEKSRPSSLQLTISSLLEYRQLPNLKIGPVLKTSHTQLRKADSTLRSSQAVPHPSTDRALSRLTSEVERDPVHSTWYGRQQMCRL